MSVSVPIQTMGFYKNSVQTDRRGRMSVRVCTCRSSRDSRCRCRVRYVKQSNMEWRVESGEQGSRVGVRLGRDAGRGARRRRDARGRLATGEERAGDRHKQESRDDANLDSGNEEERERPGKVKPSNMARTPAKTSARHHTSAPPACVSRSAPNIGVPTSMESPTMENARPIRALVEQ